MTYQAGSGAAQPEQQKIPLKKKLKKPEPCGLQTAPVAGRTTTHHSDSICRPVSTTASHSLWAQSEAWEKALEKPP